MGCTSSTAVPRDCAVCFTSKDDDEDLIFFACKDGHAICSLCFANQVRAWADPSTGESGEVSKLLRKVAPDVKVADLKALHFDKAARLIGQVPCACPLCPAVFQPEVVAKNLKMSRMDLTPYHTGTRAQTEKLQLERTRRLKKSCRSQDSEEPLLVRDRSVREIFVEDKLLNLACPNCDLAVMDFDGCFAVQCSGCKEYFCAWCVEYSGPSNECHEHVLGCPQSQKAGSYWGTAQSFESLHFKRRLRECINYLVAQADGDLLRRLKPVLLNSFGANGWADIKREVVPTLAVKAARPSLETRPTKTLVVKVSPKVKVPSPPQPENKLRRRPASNTGPVSRRLPAMNRPPFR